MARAVQRVQSRLATYNFQANYTREQSEGSLIDDARLFTLTMGAR